MNRTRLVLLTLFSTLAILMIACGSTLSGDADESQNALRGGGDTDLAAESRDLFAVPDDGAARQGLNADHFSGQVLSSSGEEAAPIDAQLGPGLDRKIIQSTSVDLEVEGENGVSRSFQDVIRIAETAGGFVASSSFSNVDDRQFGDLTIRVPGTQYQSVLAEIRGMGTVSQEGSDANDVTEEYTDLQARLRTLNATEQRYLDLLAQAGTINEILVVQDRLDVVRGQIEQVIGRVNLLDNLTDLATITVHLSPAPLIVESTGGSSGLQPSEAIQSAWQASLTVLSTIGVVLVVAAAFSWWLVPVVALAAIGTRWWTNRSRRTPAQAPAP